MRKRRAFSLTELMVVVGIIAVIVALLLPSVSKARRSARSAQCLANLRQMGLAFQFYRDQNNSKSLSFCGDQPGLFWLEQMRPFYGLDQIRLCPEAFEPSGQPAPANRWGKATVAWGPAAYSFMGENTGSYGFNGWLYWCAPHSFVPNQPGTVFGKVSDYFNLPAPGSSRIPVFGDAIWPDSEPTAADPVPRSLSNGGHGNGYPPNAPGGGMGCFCVARHGASVNLVFVDGHAENVTLGNLWGLKWSASYVPPNPLPVVK